MDAFDADVLIYAASGDPRGAEVQNRSADPSGAPIGIGSVLLMSELLVHPRRHGHDAEYDALIVLLSRIALVPVDDTVAAASVSLGARYGLKALDALHLASAVVAGADRFVTNNRRDFNAPIGEIEISFPREYEI
ncbi:type II toxin-antitoxin system VapC family toxin [Solicola gregarius]|uniref:PIN domain-containing protein n=1 Tax=Solicola gregarius TaxID=2908642 RepID=A0AA46YKS7_9ACTN|nr:PIN domain-containing protein [Solicola gregarius]UYM05802.1 PIN domain-containing protein [Solicola gregarius]